MKKMNREVEEERQIEPPVRKRFGAKTYSTFSTMRAF
jgi:hypothetical protein